MSWWGKGLGILLLLSVVIISCEDEEHLLGFKSPDENFKVVYQEFNLPTSVFQVDSVATSNSGVGASRLLSGSFNDGTFGRGSATAYFQYYPLSFPQISDTAKFDRITMTMVLDLYHFGSQVASTQTYEIHELVDSLVNSTSYYTKSSTPVVAKSVGSASKSISPALLDQTLKENNADSNPNNNVYDSLVVDLLPSFGEGIFQAVRASDSASLAKYRTFSRWRKIFKGLAMIPAGTDKVIGFDPAHSRTRITLHYREGTSAKEVRLSLSPAYGMMTYTGLSIDRTGTPLGTMNDFFVDYQPMDGQRYVHSGGGYVTKIDLTPVYKYFEAIAVKSLNVAELSIVADGQPTAPVSFMMRAVKKDNRAAVGVIKGLNEVYDSVYFTDPKFVSKHYISPNSAPRADMMGDDGTLFRLGQVENAQKATYKGYMTNFLQKEISLPDRDYLAYFTMVSSSPEFAKSLNGFRFHKDSVKLRLYYTTLNQEE